MNKKFTVLVGLLMAVAVTGYSVSGTYAKYTEDFAGATSTATVAKWDVTVGDLSSADNGADQTFTFDLFKNAKASNKSLIDGVADNMIAPGSSGAFTIKIKNSSDVKVAVSVDFTENNTAGVPLEYRVAGGTWSSSLTDVAATAITDDALNADGEYEVKVEWRWDYDANTTNTTGGKDDTTIGKDSAAANRTTVTVDATVTVSQVAAA